MDCHNVNDSHQDNYNTTTTILPITHGNTGLDPPSIGVFFYLMGVGNGMGVENPGVN